MQGRGIHLATARMPTHAAASGVRTTAPPLPSAHHPTHSHILALGSSSEGPMLAGTRKR